MKKSSGKAEPYFLLVLSFGCLFSCATMSLHSPKPLDEGEVSLGIHGGPVFVLASSGDVSGVEDFPVAGTCTFRVGLPSDFEWGLNVGTLGVDTAFKYGLMKRDNPFRLSLILGGGLYYWSLLDLNAGILAGYAFGGVFQPYGGWRGHTVGPGFLMSDVIGGFEVFFSKHVGLMAELNYTIPHVDFKRTDDSIIDLDEDDFKTAVVSVGFNFRY